MSTLLACLMLVAGNAQAGNPRYAGIVIDAESHAILYAEKADEPRYPASLTKMMTLYLLFEALEAGRLGLGQPLPVSHAAAAMPATKLYLKPGERIRVEKAIQALVVRSANDVAVVVAEALGGSEANFARMMTDKAAALGMTDTTFRNASGLPDARQVTTARDMVVLSHRLMRDFPQYYPYFSLSDFTWRGKTLSGHNRLLENYPGADGLKTGFIRASGFNVATSAVRDGRRMLSVVMGGFTSSSRDAHMANLLDRGFLRASLSDGHGWLASADISGGRLSGGRLMPGAAGQRLARTEPASGEPRRLAAATSPAATSPSRDEALVEAPASSVALARGEGDTLDARPALPGASAEDPLRELIEPEAPRDVAAGGAWGVQVGAFSDVDHARSLASRAADRLASELANARVAVPMAEGAGVYRARLVDLQEGQAHTACRRLVAQGMECMVVQASL